MPLSPSQQARLDCQALRKAAKQASQVEPYKDVQKLWPRCKCCAFARVHYASKGADHCPYYCKSLSFGDLCGPCLERTEAFMQRKGGSIAAITASSRAAAAVTASSRAAAAHTTDVPAELQHDEVQDVEWPACDGEAPEVDDWCGSDGEYEEELVAYSREDHEGDDEDGEYTAASFSKLLQDHVLTIVVEWRSEAAGISLCGVIAPMFIKHVRGPSAGKGALPVSDVPL